MFLELTPDQKTFQNTAAKFAERHFAPIVNEYEKEEKCPKHLFKDISEIGFLGANIPENLDGMGLDSVSLMLITKELTKVWAAGALALYIVPNSLVAYPVAKYGTMDQIEKYLEPMISGDRFGCFGLTEPDYGSYASGVRTSAKPINPFVDDFALNGEKTFITNVTFADFVLVLARTRQRREGKKMHDGLTAFIVDIDETCDVTEIKKMGLHSSPFGSIHFNDTPVTTENVLGREGDGYKIFMDTLESGRVFIAAQAWGVAEAAYEDALHYAKERKTFGTEIINHQSVGHMLADMTIAVKEAEFWTLYAASLRDCASIDFRKFSSAAKIRTTEIAIDVARKNVLIHGGMGYTREIRAGRLLNDALAFEIYEGSNPIQRNIIVSELKR